MRSKKERATHITAHLICRYGLDLEEQLFHYTMESFSLLKEAPQGEHALASVYSRHKTCSKIFFQTALPLSKSDIMLHGKGGTSLRKWSR